MGTTSPKTDLVDTATASAPSHKEAGAQLTLIQEHTDALMIIDRDGIVRFADQGAQALFAKSGPLVGHPSPIPIRPGSHEITVADADSRDRHVEVRVADSEWNGAAAYVASASDVTARHEVETALRAAVDAARDAGPIAHSLLADLSHAVRTPLTDIVGFSELMKDERLGPIDNERYKSYLADIHSSSLRLLRLIEDALNKAGTPSDLETKASYARASDIVRLARACRRGDDETAFTIEMPDDVGPLSIEIERASLTEAFRLLLTDAARNATATRPAQLSIDHLDDQVVIEVSESWLGYSDADLAYMLDGGDALAAASFALNPTKQRVHKTATAFAAMKRMTELYGGMFAILGNGDNGVRLRIKLNIVADAQGAAPAPIHDDTRRTAPD